MRLQQMVFQIDNLLSDLVLAVSFVQLCCLQPPYIDGIGGVCPFTPIKVAPSVAMWVTVGGIPQVGADVGVVNL